MIKFLELSKLTIDEIRRTFDAYPPVLIAGSVVSSFEPSNLPTGAGAINKLLALLFRSNNIIADHVEKKQLETIQRTIPF